MATQNILFEHRIDGVLTDYDSLMFSSEDDPLTPGAYGLRQTDTQTVIISAGTNFNHDSLGEYSYLVTGLTLGAPYDFWVKRVYQGRTVKQQYNFVGSSAVPISPLFTWDQFVNKYGLRNIIMWSNKDSTQSNNNLVSVIPQGEPNWYAVQDAFNYATEEVYSWLRGGVLLIPLDFTPNAGVVPARVSRWAMTIARGELQEVRFTQDKLNDKAYKPLERQLEAVYWEMSAYRTGEPGHQMPEALQDPLFDSVPEAVSAFNGGTGQIGVVNGWRGTFGCVRYIDGAWSFLWN
jgi:hypothetical protein